MKSIKLIDKLEASGTLEKEEFVLLLSHHTRETGEYLFEKARNVTNRYFNGYIYLRGLIEITNYCKNDCYYCGIRRSNRQVARYRLSPEEILACCDMGYPLGFRTFVLQGGEDAYYSDETVISIVKSIKAKYPDCAVTLSIGEKSYESYLNFFKAGADRYLLRHETADSLHYSRLHPLGQTLESRKSCLYALKDIGYQVGTGFMVGSPFQTKENLAEDLLFIKELRPEMIGIGPFISHHDTPFADQPSGSMESTLFVIGILRLMIPNALIPATTALGTIDPDGRARGILAGANVVMPNLSPQEVRKKYALYDNKICTDEEAAEGILQLREGVEKLGYKIKTDRGDFNPLNSKM
ncbi:MAG: [FeFe] hydrogenase H-cluster radical SAM maturase HydE [Eubacteriales bacterium]|nr:[FeFe] hydrogenase H-cluster radical SAM maturase HydE [Eubacteriales bacterium]